jgi:hypothetical protein
MGISSGRNNHERAVFLARWPKSDFNVLTQSREKFHKASNGKIARAVSHQQGHLRLLHAENFGDLDLCHAAVLEDRADLQRELSLKQFLHRVGKPKVCEDVSAVFGYAGNARASFSGLRFHFSSAFLQQVSTWRHFYTSIRISVYLFEFEQTLRFEVILHQAKWHDKLPGIR